MYIHVCVHTYINVDRIKMTIFANTHTYTYAEKNQNKYI